MSGERVPKLSATMQRFDKTYDDSPVAFTYRHLTPLSARR